VTANKKCGTCGQRFKPARTDARYCSGACRQRAARARSRLTKLDREIEAARLTYWSLIREKEIALGKEVMSRESQFVDADGNVFMYGQLVGRSEPVRPGWNACGLEAAPAPWCPPPGSAA